MRRIVLITITLLFISMSCVTQEQSQKKSEEEVFTGRFEETNWFIGVNKFDKHFYFLLPEKYKMRKYEETSVLFVFNDLQKVFEVHVADIKNTKLKTMPKSMSQDEIQELLLAYQDYERKHQEKVTKTKIERQKSFTTNDLGLIFNNWSFIVNDKNGKEITLNSYTCFIDGCFFSFILTNYDNSQFSIYNEYLKNIAHSLTISSTPITDDTFQAVYLELYTE